MDNAMTTNARALASLAFTSRFGRPATSAARPQTALERETADVQRGIALGRISAEAGQAYLAAITARG